MSAVTEAIYAETPRNGMVGAAQNALGVVNAVLARLSAAAIGIAGCVLTWEVFGRHFWDLPSDWQDELAIFLLIGATFLSAAWTQGRRGHVAIEALSAILPPRVDRVRRVLVDIFGCVFCGFFAWKAVELTLEAWSEGQTSSSSWAPPLWIPYSAMAAGMALLTLQLLLQVMVQPPRETMPVGAA